MEVSVPKINFVRPNGSQVVVEAAPNLSVMRAATEGDLWEIIAECGGVLACATCHVRLAPQSVDLFPPPSTEELEMLGFSKTPPDETSRLSCQLVLTEAMDEVTVNLLDN
jgi:2Fe-2S ferredoxin